MATSISFESAREKERKRNELREARHHLLEKAKKQYEKEERKKEQAKLRGEDTWMLPSVNQRIEQDSQSLEKVKSKKHKKEKKKKKHKEKKKRKKKHEDRSSESDSDSSEALWIEKSTESNQKNTPAVKGPRMERDSWMEAPLDLMATVSRQDLIEKKRREKEEQDKQKNLLDQPGQHAKELNPYWRDGGTGVPEDKTSDRSEVKAPLTSGIGDGGLAWLRKSYQRCVEQAKEEGRSLEELAAERWGSLEKIQSMLKEAESLAGGSHRRQNFSERKSWQRGKFARPSEGNTDSPDRKHTRSRSRSRSPQRHSSHKQWSRKRSRSHSPKSSDRKHRHSRSRSRSRSRDRHRSRSRDRKRDHRSRSRSYERNSSGRKKRDSRSTSRERKRSRSRERTKALDRYSSSSSRSLSGRFMRPGELNERESTKISASSTSSSNRVPAWKKKTGPSSEQHDSDRVQSSSKKNKENEERERKRRVSSSDSDSSSEESGDDSSDEPQGQSSQPEVIEVKVLTEKEMNDLGAKILKAELMGNQAQADKLKAQLEAAREAQKTQGAKPTSQRQGSVNRLEGGEDMVVLTRTDRSGLSRPVPDRKHPVEPKGGRRKKQKVETHTGSLGERTKYFDDDDKFDLKTMVEREKMGTAEDQNQMFARLAGRSTIKTDDDFQVDDMFLSKANKKQSDSIQEERERAQAIFEHKKMASALEKCQFCFGNVPKHLIIAIGTKVYLCLPNHRSLTEGHCLIVPMQHAASGTAVDEDVWNEIQVFRKCLTNMFSERDEDVVFMETSMGLKRIPHMTVECVPMEKEIGDMAPVYFKKAIMECETEWSQNKKVVDISQKDIRHAIPKGFPYFAVDFGLQGGFAHVIEDEQIFPSYFGKEIIGGMIDVEPRLWRKPLRENFDEQRKKVMKFAEMWKPYDWTQKLAQAADSDD